MKIKRMAAHCINRSILFIPTLLLLGGAAYLVNPDYFIFDTGENTGWDILYLYRYMLFLPLVFKDLVTVFPAAPLSILTIIGPALLCMTALEIASILWLKRHAGMKIMGLALLSLKGPKLSFLQIVTRTLLKYVSLAFFPIAFVYIFLNEESTTLHDKISGTKVIGSVQDERRLP